MARIWTPKVSKQIIKVGADEAEQILQYQAEILDLPSLEIAEAIQKELKRRGIETKVIAEVGSVISEPRNLAEQILMKDLNVHPGTRFLRYGLTYLGAYRSKQRLLRKQAIRRRPVRVRQYRRR